MDELRLATWAIGPLWGILRRCEHADHVNITMHTDGEFQSVHIEAVWSDGSTAEGRIYQSDKTIWFAINDKLEVEYA